jgi:hypothetical protein
MLMIAVILVGRGGQGACQGKRSRECCKQLCRASSFVHHAFRLQARHSGFN